MTGWGLQNYRTIVACEPVWPSGKVDTARPVKLAGDVGSIPCFGSPLHFRRKRESCGHRHLFLPRDRERQRERSVNTVF